MSERRNPRGAAVSEWPAPFGQRSALSIPLSVPPHTPRTEDGRLARIVQAQHEDARLPIPKQGEQARHPETHCACRFFALGLCAELSLSLSLCLSLSPGGGGYAGGEGGCVRRMCAGRRRMGHSTRLVLKKSAVKTDKKTTARPQSHIVLFSFRTPSHGAVRPLPLLGQAALQVAVEGAPTGRDT